MSFDQRHLSPYPTAARAILTVSVAAINNCGITFPKAQMSAYLILAASAFLAATILPFYSELLLIPLLLEGKDPLGLWLAATIGNTLGAVVNWWIGRFLVHFEDRKWFPFKPHKLHRAQRWFQRFGVWSLLFAWLPVVGDPLTFIAGVMRTRFTLFLVLVFLGKGARYAVIIWLTEVAPYPTS